MSDTSDYIKLQWDDIHHSRSQDWRVILIISGIITALIAKENLPPEYITALLTVGLILSFIGFYISVTHWIIFRSKMSKISLCEKKLDFVKSDPRFYFRFNYGIFGVQQMIMIIYSLFISSLVSWILIHFKDYTNLNFKESYIIGLFVFSILCFASLYKKAILLRFLFEKKSKKEHFLDSVFYAPKKDINECLNYLGDKPLKLIAPELYDLESEWIDKLWTFQLEKNSIKDKKVFLNINDLFQISVANSQSKQEKHIHKSTFEVYISESEIEVFTTNDENPTIKSNGVILIPPNVLHYVKLQGLTYVIQISSSSKKIKHDKEIRI